MACLLKEALKALCRPNWSYAVFWKFAPQNPMVLIWEECYYGLLPGISMNGNLDFELGFPVENESSLLMNEMMIEAHVNVVGQGLVGHVAFTGDHLWVLSENHCGEAHPPEVLKLVSQQFSAGIQTIAVIPVLPHGVIQFGSYLRIPEDMRFVDAVVLLWTQLGDMPGVLQPQNYPGKEHVSKTLIPVFPGYSTLNESSVTYAGSFPADSVLEGQLSYTLPGGIENGLQPSVNVFRASNVSPCNLPGSVADYGKQKIESLHRPMNDADVSVQSQSSDDLFDFSGTDFKHGSFSGYHLNLDSRIFSSNAVALNVHRSMDDDNVSCRTKLPNKMSSSLTYSRPRPSDQLKGALLGIPTSLAIAPSKEDPGAYSRSSSVCNLWIENSEQNNSISSEHSRKPGEAKGVDRKRVKRGKNPRPRRKDYQIIKNRLKELRKLVPDGKKCSIDALLQGTVKHVLFLQSITKHATTPPQSKIR